MEYPIGPNPCSECGGEYGEHQAFCDRSNPTQFRKKPVVVTAEQFFVWKRPWPKGVVQETIAGDASSLEGAQVEWYVTTIHGQKTRVQNEDWVITELDGIHHYPCKPDIFAATYEAI